MISNFNVRSCVITFLISLACGYLTAVFPVLIFWKIAQPLILLSPLIITLLITSIFQLTNGQKFGIANAITLIRLNCVFWLIVCLLFKNGAWIYFAVPAFLLDAVDGWAARKFRTASVFGKYFDMETDNLLILAGGLAFGVRHDHWIAFSIGLIPCAYRYFFVMGIWLLKPKNKELPPAIRRKLICVIQMFAAVFQFFFIPPQLSIYYLADFLWILAWVLLTLSFLIDIFFLTKINSSYISK